MLWSTYHPSICISGFTIGLVCATHHVVFRANISAIRVVCSGYHLNIYVCALAAGVLCSTSRLDNLTALVFTVATLRPCTCWPNFQDVSFSTSLAF